MLKKPNGEKVSPKEALEFLYQSTKNLHCTAMDHEKLFVAYNIVKDIVEKKEKENNE